MASAPPSSWLRSPACPAPRGLTDTLRPSHGSAPIGILHLAAVQPVVRQCLLSSSECSQRFPKSPQLSSNTSNWIYLLQQRENRQELSTHAFLPAKRSRLHTIALPPPGFAPSRGLDHSASEGTCVLERVVPLLCVPAPVLSSAS